MLELKNIYKDYYVDKKPINALKDINLFFPISEFCAILGPSGCGKTTLLNIIGGLDRYTSGDLIIEGISTKTYTDREWDNYRNKKIGFVFQNYNLIPHLSILSNVELAMNLKGVSKKDRIKQAKEALNKVGLSGIYNKKPNQLSGGQMQRVAIARALVNDPDVILADEPTGALDSKTSIQVMEILKEISKEKLVIMVTHNEKLAYSYADRVIIFKDGEIESDSKDGEKDVQEKCDSVMQVYREQIETLRRNGLDEIGGITISKLSTFKEVERNMQRISDFSEYTKEVVETDTRQVEKPGLGAAIGRFFGGFFGTDWGWEDEEFEVTRSYVDLRDYVQDQMGAIISSMQKEIKTLVDATKEEVNTMTANAIEQSQKVNDLIHQIAEEYENKTRDIEALRKEIEENRPIYEFAEKIISEVEDLLAIE